MPSEADSAALNHMQGGARRYFTVDEANRALVLVRRVVQDMVDRHRELMGVRNAIEAAQGQPSSNESLELVNKAVRLNQRLIELLDELTSLGCEYKDWSSGLVDFPSRMNGREVYLCWRLGELSVSHWHEMDAGFAGRRPIVSASSN